MIDPFQQAGAELGLPYTPREHAHYDWVALRGHIDGRWVTAALACPTKLARRGLYVVVGHDPPFDFQFPPSSAHHVARQRSLWSKELLEEMETLSVVASIRFQNEGIVAYRGMGFDAARIVQVVRGSVSIANACHERRRWVAVAPDLVEHEAAWRAAADDLGLELCSAPLGMFGRVHGAVIGVFVFRHVVGLGVTIRLRFEQPMDLGLSVDRTRGAERLLTKLGWQDIETGDELFDRTYRVQGTEPDRVREVLTDDVRQAYTELDERFPVELDDDGLKLRYATLGVPEAVPSIVQAGARLMEALHVARFGKKRTGGPYR